MQNHYNLLYREEEREMIPLCISEGIGIVPWSPMARGVLTRPLAAQSTARSGSDQYTPTLYGAEHDAAILTELETVASKLGKPMAQVALAWLLSRPGVTAPIVGATKLSQLADAIDATEIALDEDSIKALEAPYGPRQVAGIS
jgi:aryl-alcohol dehydrogenase-like predicted oxidoreductase